MELYEEIIAREVGRAALTYLEGRHFNYAEMVGIPSYDALVRIKAVLDNKCISEFECVEEIICIFEDLGGLYQDPYDL